MAKKAKAKADGGQAAPRKKSDPNVTLARCVPGGLQIEDVDMPAFRSRPDMQAMIWIRKGMTQAARQQLAEEVRALIMRPEFK